MAQRVAFVLKGYPRLSETFIAQEILSLEQRGLDIDIVSLRHPTDQATHPVHDEIVAPVNYLPEYLYQEPGRVLRGWRRARRLPGYREARRVWLADLKRDFSTNRVRRFGQALVLAAELPPDIEQIHAHFLHTPGSVARYTAMIIGLQWSVSAHAKDIWTIPEREVREKLADCRWLTTCTRYNCEHLKGVADDSAKVHLNYHGIDLRRFPPPIGFGSDSDGTDPENPVRILSVGRAVTKKGYAGLLEALAMLPDNLHWRLVYIGGGPLLDQLRRQAEALGLGDRLEWLGPRSQQDVLKQYRSADLFALNSRIDDNGDRDGLPNVLLEAQSQGLPVVATDISGIPELVQDGVNGLLV
ncbi:MAG: glycosyltransferase, partial [Pseudomonadota bacterium]|nr:glycosyltransferase [Pseudomonadota bacterium]